MTQFNVLGDKANQPGKCLVVSPFKPNYRVCLVNSCLTETVKLLTDEQTADTT